MHLFQDYAPFQTFLTFCYISVITEGTDLKLEVCVTIKRTINTIKGDNSKCIFF